MVNWFEDYNTVINSGSKIGENCIVNTGTIIEHDCVIEDYVHLSYRVVVGSRAEVCEGSFLDMNSIVVRGKKVEKGSE